MTDLADKIDPKSFLAARAEGFEGWGLQRSDIEDGVREIERFAGGGPGSWETFWRSRADAARSSQPFRACLCLGASKYPLLGSPELERLLAEQLAILTPLAAAGAFERKIANLSVGGRSITVPYHLYGQRWRQHGRLVCLCGGLDTYKAELHRMAKLLASWTECCVLVVDMPGTAETATQADIDGENFFDQLFAAAMPDRRQTCFIGISFAGYWALRLAFARKVDAAVDVGGPVSISQRSRDVVAELPFDMVYILLSALRLSDLNEASALLERLSAQFKTLLSNSPVPVLAINGDRDPYVPTEDVTFLRAYPEASVVIVEGSGHCAARKLWRVFPKIVHWIRLRMDSPSSWTVAARVLDALIAPTTRS
jgi:esterase FrsA